MANRDPKAAPMMRVSLALVGVVATVAWAPDLSSQARFRASTEAVILDVSVTDEGRPVVGLTPDDFVVLDNGVTQALQDLTAERLPIDVHITVDISGSLSFNERAVLVEAIEHVRNGMAIGDRMSVMEFGTHVQESSPLAAPDQSKITLGYGVDTAVLDAMLLALVRPDVPGRRAFSLFLTDGDDTASYFDSTVVLDTARFSKGPMTIVLAPDRAAPPAGGVLRSIAIGTGGELLTLRNRDSLRETFAQALENFRSSYVLRYTPAGVAAGGWHDVRVSVRNSRYRVRARQGYDAGGK
jgi:VWFA-related protein